MLSILYKDIYSYTYYSIIYPLPPFSSAKMWRWIGGNNISTAHNTHVQICVFAQCLNVYTPLVTIYGYSSQHTCTATHVHTVVTYLTRLPPCFCRKRVYYNVLHLNDHTFDPHTSWMSKHTYAHARAEMQNEVHFVNLVLPSNISKLFAIRYTQTNRHIFYMHRHM